MEMETLLKKVKKELDAIADKGITSSNLETTYKLIDIYKDIKEVDGMEMKNYDRYNDYDGRGDYNARGGGRGGSYDDKYYIERFNNNDRYGHYPLDERNERYLTRMREGIYDYNAGRMRYRDGGSDQRMIDGIEMTMGAIVNFVESLMDCAETSQEKEIVRKYVNKIKNV